ncbi:hypothetical protein E2C01_090598 [Portunus trituberculatus]|uniref:Uncharacterized protein n=1 Tax=Portunus trituberculatus TaxID=210409 RepID=A0A5B7JKK9_PORTR|nr:hypothetical protein [Portunus trituberculatus]
MMIHTLRTIGVARALPPPLLPFQHFTPRQVGRTRQVTLRAESTTCDKNSHVSHKGPLSPVTQGMQALYCRTRLVVPEHLRAERTACNTRFIA